MCRLLIIALLLCGIVAGGCTRVPQPGGSQNTKSEKARKAAEELAVNVVSGVARTQAKAVPELTASERGDRSGRLNLSQSRAASEFVALSPNGLSAKIYESINLPPPRTPIGPVLPGATQPVATATSNAPRLSAVKEVAPKAPPRPGSPAIIWEHVVSSLPSASVAEAENDALSNAQDAIERRLANLDPPVKYRPTLNEVENEFTRKDSRITRPPPQAELESYLKSGVDPKVVAELVYAEYDVEVTADQIREIRTRDRVTLTMRAFGGFIFLALAGFFFLRADEWTKGYLTRWLACGAVILVGGAVAALYFV
jgi:hypothetical protein